MKTGNTRIEYPIFKVRVLILIYTLLCVIIFFFSRNFYIDTLQGGEMPGRLHLTVFFTIPILLMIVLGISFFNLLSDFISKRPGSRFNIRLLGYFAIIVIFSVAPVTLMTSTALNEIVRFWHSIDTPSTTRYANSLIADNYSLHMERFENIIRNNDFSALSAQSAAQSSLPKDIVSVQTFVLTDGEWNETSFTGSAEFRLPFPPSAENGVMTRELPRDTGTIRYAQRAPRNTLRLISYDLGNDFDRGKSALENQAVHFESVNELRKNMQPLLIYYYVVFILPTLLMTAIIAISFTRRISRPIVDLTEATRRVAEGDFSIQILTRRSDELGLLIKSFNSMVQELEKSRAALVKSEKISIWQNMAQQLAHEIKNPLTPIKLSAERVLRRYRNEPEKVNEILENSMLAIIQETEGLSVLLNEFKTLSKPMEPSKSLTDLKIPVLEIINTYSPLYPGIEFQIDHIESDHKIKIDKNRIIQILTNIIINAIDAMDGKGLIEIRTDLVKKREVCYCRISVKDSGKGISEQERTNVFTPYFTTKESGTGLGLPIVERIINDHSGAIWFDSAPGIGTTFYIDLPTAWT